jgi:sRNA-binding protein
MTLTYDDLFSTQEAREHLALSAGQWNYLYSIVQVIKPIPIGQRVYREGQEGGEERHTTCLFSRRQLDELRARLLASDNHKTIEPVEPTPDEIAQIYSIAEAAEKMGKNASAVRMHLNRHKDVPRKKVGGQIVLLLETVNYLDDPYGLKAERESHEQTA